MNRRVWHALTTLALAGALAACSTTGAKSAGDRLDPWEKWNRKVFSFNEGVDEHVMKPVATAYSNVVPGPVRRGIDNFFSNAADAWSAVNNVLQGKVTDGLSDMMRFGTNTLFGLAGFLDVASEMGMERHREDFGQTLGRWGVPAGPYIVWPLLGPSTLRESFAMPLDMSVSPAAVFNEGAYKWSITALQLVNARSNLLGASRVVDDIALDKYTFIRDAYLQRRRSLLFDGDPPEEGAAGPADHSPAPGLPASSAEGGTAAPVPVPAQSPASESAR